MLPMLRQGRDLITVMKKTGERCGKYDVVLYRRPPDKYVLHRVVEVREKDYVILGDNCLHKEYGITDGDILGVLTGFQRGGRHWRCDDWRYRAYARVWYAFFPWRRIVMRVKGKLKRWARKTARR